ncbi:MULTISPECIES: double-strand break repair helicase AddA [Hyphobacterium]|uniref:DNA 3'-5' helicase n=1 Tax=Hyphobacterium vulgare TaxID=1736751 RepID=A0ABV6ZXV5_9PROT
MTSVIARASEAQARAADPGYNIFVEANAGSGKTRVLVDRVTRLLLNEVAPDTILCLTYTKAAAGEMKTRLFDRLGGWSVLADEPLEAELKRLIGEPSRDDLTRARRLFARALETPGGLKIQTIHAFCEGLLKRFPLEAGVPPGFDVVDEAHAERFRRTARSAVMRAAGRDKGMRSALETLAARSSEALDQVLTEAVFDRQRLGDLFETPGTESLIARLHEALGIPEGLTADAARIEAWEDTDFARLKAAEAEMQHAVKDTERKHAAAIGAAFAAPSSVLAYEAYCAVFLTQKGEPRAESRFLTVDFKRDFPLIADFILDERERIVASITRVRAAQVAGDTAAALRIASVFLSAYGEALTTARKLDFSDLVHAAARLLKRSEAADWVRYRMDGGIRHILVDEAQDTAPEQWSLIEAIADEFFTGGRETEETVFCVGDEKQSIYSFQGADPKGFIAWGERLAGKATLAEKRFDRPGLAASFRSSGLVLAAVDLAFGPEGGAPEVKFVVTEAEQYARSETAFTRYQSHLPAFDKPGTIEIWPLVPRPEKAEAVDPFSPVDLDSPGSPKMQLAAAIAGEIERMLKAGEAVPDRDAPSGERAVQPQDIMILVRKRDGFFSEVIRQLKIRNVPVAGADRMVLTQQVAVQDLLSLARFALNPDDELSLAEVLKSPFFHAAGGPFVLDDAALYDLAYGRGGKTLWQVLRESREARFAEAREALERVLGSARTTGVHSVFARFLGEVTSTGETRLKRVFARLGEEQRDAIEEFLARALAFEREETPSLTRFVGAMDRETGEIKREMEAGRGEVRVMTVHASKGLEAPVVFLPDTVSPPSPGSKSSLFRSADFGWVWGLKKDAEPDLPAALRAAEAERAEGESWRQLYVALTRAESRLVVCGAAMGNRKEGLAERSWYDRLNTLWAGESWTEFASPVPGAILPGRRLGEAPKALGAVTGKTREDTVPDWAISAAPVEHAPRRSMAPSQLAAESEPAALSPLSGSQDHRFRRGNLVHKLLQTLPDLPDERRAGAAERYLERQPDLPDTERAEIAAETLAVLNHPDFAPIFGPGSRAEVSIGGHAPGLPENVTLSGQIDRLVVTGQDVLVIDYKTNRPPPGDLAGVADIYWMQMAAYRALLQAIHPGKTVRCALLWTDGPRLMELPGDSLDAALAKGFAAQAAKLDDAAAAS